MRPISVLSPNGDFTFTTLLFPKGRRVSATRFNPNDPAVVYYPLLQIRVKTTPAHVLLKYALIFVYFDDVLSFDADIREHGTNYFIFMTVGELMMAHF